jgi:hypothetical protein
VAWSRGTRILLPLLAALSLAVSFHLAGPLRDDFYERKAPPSALQEALRAFYDAPVFVASAVIESVDEWGTEQMWAGLLFPGILLQNLALWALARLALRHAAAR